MEVQNILLGDKVPLPGSYFELFVVPVDDTHPISLTVCQVARQVTPHPGPEQRRDPPCGGQVVLIDVIQHLVIQRNEVLNFWLSYSILAGCDVREGMANQQPSMLVFNSFKKLKNTVHNIVLQN